MTDKILAVDAGNSRITFAILDKETVLHKFSISSSANPGDAESELKIVKWLHEIGLEAANINKSVCCSVIHEKNELLGNIISRIMNQPPFFIKTETFPFPIHYSPPQSAGVDRLACARAAFEYSKSQVLVIDAGTALTFSLVNGDGSFAGGAITAGAGTIIKSLKQVSAKLPDPGKSFSAGVIGKSTVEGLRSGIFGGLVFLIDGYIQALRKELQTPFHTVITGGFATLLFSKTKGIERIDENLIFKGMVLLLADDGK